MTSQLYTAPYVTYARIANQLWVNKAPNPANPSSTKARKLNPITRQGLPKHKRPRRRD